MWSKIRYVVVILILVLALYSQKRYTGSGHESVIRGYGMSSESIETLLRRSMWCNNFKKRMSMTPRVFITAFIATCLVCLVVYDRLPRAEQFTFILIVLFMVCMASNRFFEFHSDCYSGAYIHRNLEEVMKKLGVVYEDPPEPLEKQPRDSDMYWRWP